MGSLKGDSVPKDPGCGEYLQGEAGEEPGFRSSTRVDSSRLHSASSRVQDRYFLS
jgi:hypothetical protein